MSPHEQRSRILITAYLAAWALRPVARILIFTVKIGSPWDYGGESLACGYGSAAKPEAPSHWHILLAYCRRLPLDPSCCTQLKLLVFCG